jgi:DNA polymerase IV
VDPPAEPILHVDMDAFYASVEQRDDPALRDRPVVVGGAGSRGVVAAASYEARRYGIQSAMPVVRARRLCPGIVVVAPDFDRYRRVSREVRDILLSYTPLVEPLALDEAFLDVGGSVRLFGTPLRIAESIREEVRVTVGLTCSVGVAATKFLAKLCSTKAKPDGLLHLAEQETDRFLRPLPVSDLWGAGPKTVERLEQYGFKTVGQVADADVRTLERVVGGAAGRALHRLARGEDDRRVVPHEPAKSVSAEETFTEDVDDPDVLRREVLALCDRVGRRLRASGLAGRTIALKVRFSSFQTVTRSVTLDLPTDRTHDLVTHASTLLEALRLERARVRLLGVGVSNLTEGTGARQLELAADVRWEDAETTMDELAERYGRDAVTYATLLDTGLDDAPTRDDLS